MKQKAITQKLVNQYPSSKIDIIPKGRSQNGRESINHRIWWDGRVFLGGLS
jgi:hypothetical protein